MTRLSDLQIDEVSLVRKGANQHARVAIAKSAESGAGGEVPEIFDQDGNLVEDLDTLEDGEIVFDEDGTAYQYDAEGDEDDEDDEVEKAAYIQVGGKTAKLGRRSTNAILATRRARQRGGAAVSRAGGAMRTAGSSAASYGRTAGIAGEVVARRGAQLAGQGAGAVAGGATRGARATRQAAGNAGNAAATGLRRGAASVEGYARAPMGGVDTRGRVAALGAGGLLAGGGAGYAGGRVRKSYGLAEDLREELSKSLTDDDRDAVISKAFGALEEMSEIAKAAEAVALEEREAREFGEYLEVAKSYVGLPVSEEDLALAMKAVNDYLDPADVETIATCLGFAADAAGAMYDEIGKSGGGDNTDIMQQVEAFTQNQVSKGASASDVMTGLFESNPALYDQYLAELSGN